jgi:AbrB family looped-hinge helix DNA binding protein
MKRRKPASRHGTRESAFAAHGLAEETPGFAYGTGTVTSKGQTTIPKVVRDQLKLKAGDTLTYVLKGDHVVLRAKNKSIRDLRGVLARPGQRPVTLAEMDQAIAEAAASYDRPRHEPARPPRRPR